MARFQNIEEQMAGLNIEEEENEELVFEDDIEEEVDRYELCLVGRFLTEKNINTRAMKTKMADVWKPTMGINIKEIETGIFLFQFYHKEDMQWVLNGGPWAFDNVMLLVDVIPQGMDPLRVQLWFLNIWIQVHDLPNGFMTEAVGKQLGNFFGEFLLYDVKNNTSIWRECMRIKIKLDVRKPLKRKKRITRRNGSEFIVTCKYERLGDFCFSCGLVTHTDRFCRRFIDKRGDEGIKEWGTWLRAVPRRSAGQERSKWLRDENDVGWEERIGRGNSGAKFQGENSGGKGKEIAVRRDFRDTSNISKFKNNMESGYGGLILSNGPDNTVSFQHGPEVEEDIGLNLEDRKRRRSGPESKGPMDTEGEFKVIEFSEQNNTTQEAFFSDLDSAASSQFDLAKLAQQASRSS